MTLPYPRDSELWFFLLLWHWHSLLAKPIWLCCAVALIFDTSTTHQSTHPCLFHSFYNAMLSTYNAQWRCRGSDTDFRKVWSLSVSLENMSLINTNKQTRCGTNFRFNIKHWIQHWEFFFLCYSVLVGVWVFSYSTFLAFRPMTAIFDVIIIDPYSEYHVLNSI